MRSIKEYKAIAQEMEQTATILARGTGRNELAYRLSRYARYIKEIIDEMEEKQRILESGNKGIRDE